MKPMFLIALILALLTAAFAQDSVNFKVLDMPVGFSTIREYKVITIRNKNEWQAYWNRYVTANVEENGQWKPMPLPTIDFKQFEIVAVHLGNQSESGAKITVASATLTNEDYKLIVKREFGPMIMHHASNPALLIQLPKSRGNVNVVVQDSSSAGNGIQNRSGFSSGGG